MPFVELLEEVRIDFEQIEGGRARQRGRLHEAQEEEQIVQLGGLLPQLLLVAAERGAAKEVGEPCAAFGELLGPDHDRDLRTFAAGPRVSGLAAAEAAALHPGNAEAATRRPRAARRWANR